MFQDRARIRVEGGRGGNGAIAFRREKYVPRGGPSGGDGGAGGAVVLVADPDRRDLSYFVRRPHIRAGRGRHGEGSSRTGADGSSTRAPVPVGTQVFDEGNRLIADLAHAGARVTVARGGRGGAGNRRFATPVRRAPRVAEPGLPGEDLAVELRLKLLADAALVGFPNAGKSSLLRRISNAEPKVADYPFTTLAPVLGTVESGDGRQRVVADVPGLIEGASDGAGLGHEFLAHLERARLLLHVIDPSEGDALDRFEAVDAELRAYGAGLDSRGQLVVLNKVDLGTAPAFATRDERVVGVIATSAITGAGIDELRDAIFSLVPDVVQASQAELADYLVYRPAAPRHRPFRILRTETGWLVTGAQLEGVDEAEVEAALRQAGARDGDEVTIGEQTSELR
ncbi:MAG: GTPase ObgE [Gaiellales bacterium]